MKLSRVGFVSPLLLSAVLAAGCGSSSSSSSSSAPSSSSAGASTASTSTAPASGTMVAITSKHSKLGTVLAGGGKKLTVYMFEGDKRSTSSCTGACAKAWPPVTGTPAAAGQAVSADLATIKLADGSTQVTYKGHPLYYFIKDKDDGDAYGEGVKAFGASWYVLTPSGKKIDKS